MKLFNKLFLITIFNSFIVATAGNNIYAQFTYRVGGSFEDVGHSIAVDGSGNVYVTGNFQSIVDFDPGTDTTNLASVSLNDVFFAKYNSSGALVWAKSVGGINDDVGYSIAVDDSGNVYVTGYFEDTVDFDPGADTTNLTSTGFDDVFFAKYNSSGALAWVKNVGGSNTSDVGYSIAVDGSGNVYVTGLFQGTVDFDPGAGTTNLTSAGDGDVFFAKYNSSGALVWAKNVGGSNNDVGYSIAVDGSSNVYVTGYFQGTADFDPNAGTTNLTSAGSADVFFAKYNSSGALVWAKNVGGTNYDVGYSIAVNGSGNVYLTGNFEGTADFDPDAGTTNLTSAGYDDLFFAKYDENGSLIITGIENEAGIPISYSLSQNYPNPFNPSTEIKFSIPQDSHIKLELFNTLGEKVATLINKEMSAGFHNYQLSISNYQLPSGIYFYRLQSENHSAGSGQGFVDTKKMILLK